MPGKLVLQQLCRGKYDWDENVPLDELTKWNEWLEDFPKLQDITIPRCVKPPELRELQSVQLHHFSDASNVGYGAVSYLRLKDLGGNIHYSLLLGKSRVVPLKPLTTLRLELTAAVVAVRLNRQIQEELECSVQEVTYWTDSTVVLQYINSEAGRFQTYVANRLAVIHDYSKPSQWRYVGTKFNPADHASRGIYPSESRKAKCWLAGPGFLWQNEINCPARPDGLKAMSDEHLEWRKNVTCHAHSSEEGQDEPLDLVFKRYSSGYSWILRYRRYLRERSSTSPKANSTRSDRFTRGPLQVKEIRAVTKAIVRHIQRRAFPREHEALEMAKRDTIPGNPNKLVLCGKDWKAGIRKEAE